MRAAERRESPGAYRGFRFSTQLAKAYPRLPAPPLHPHPPRYARDDAATPILDVMVGFLRILVGAYTRARQ